MAEFMSRDWTIKFASALVPRGMEFNTDFIQALMAQLQKAVFEEFVMAVKKDKDGSMQGKGTEIEVALRSAAVALDKKEVSIVCHLNDQSKSSSPVAAAGDVDNTNVSESPDGQKIPTLDAYWAELIGNIEVPEGTKKALEIRAMSAKTIMLILANIVEYAKGAHERNDRISSQVCIVNF
jgi:hypothetical protein